MEVKNKILFVMIITLITMIAEVFFGIISNSMALLADGIHMGTHVFAFGISYIAYYFCQKFANSLKFKSGTDKIKELAGFTSSLVLGVSGLFIIYHSFDRFINPLNIEFNQAVLVALIGLVVNIVSILIMDFHDICNHVHHVKHTHTNRDNNFKSAYFHILADILTSVFAIVALIMGKYFGLIILDPIIGVLGGLIILKWSIDLIKSTAINLLDIDMTK